MLFRSVLYATGGAPFIEVGETEPTITARTSGFMQRFGVEIERQVSLMSFGRTLVGQDRLRTPSGQRKFSGKLSSATKVTEPTPPGLFIREKEPTCLILPIWI